MAMVVYWYNNMVQKSVGCVYVCVCVILLDKSLLSRLLQYQVPKSFHPNAQQSDT